MTDNGSLDYLQDDWDFCPVCDRRERDCICTPDDEPIKLGSDDDAAGYGSGFENQTEQTRVIDLVAVLKASLLGGRRS